MLMFFGTISVAKLEYVLYNKDIRLIRANISNAVMPKQ